MVASDPRSDSPLPSEDGVAPPLVQILAQPRVASSSRRTGRAPPIDPFTGEDPTIRLDDWLPSLDRASTWNGWSLEEKYLQLAGHLRGRALEEWNLLSEVDIKTYDEAVSSVRERLDPGFKVLAGQDFHHASQKETKSVSDYVRRLERTFVVAYCKGSMSRETRDTIL